MSHESAGAFRRLLRTLGRALKRRLLGRSTHDYGSQFTGGEEYWDRVVAAQSNWPQKPSPNPDPQRLRRSEHAVMRDRASVRDVARQRRLMISDQPL